MPKHAKTKERETAENKEKYSQNQAEPAKNTQLKTKSKNREENSAGLGQEPEGQPQLQPKTADKTKQLSRSTIQFVSAMNYLVFFVGFCACRHEPFARYHHNQALWLWIIATVLYLGFGFIPNVNIVALPFVIMLHVMGVITGVSTALRGRIFTIPLLGKIKIIDWEKV